MIVNFIIGILKCLPHFNAHVAQSVECRLGKAEVVGSIPIVSSKRKISIETLGKVYLKIRRNLQWQSKSSKEVNHT